MKIAVLGCGPAGLMACHAAQEFGDVDVLSRKVASPMGGAQYLHEPIPGVSENGPDGTITYAKLGDAEGYAHKVYGSANAPTSWEKFHVGEHPAWSLSDTYQQLMMLYWEKVHDHIVEPLDVKGLCEHYDLVLSTVPARFLCKNQAEHSFSGKRVVLVPSAKVDAHNVVLYNGRPEEDWYRTSNLFGEGWTEYTEQRAPKQYQPSMITGVVNGVKPLETDCACHSEHGNFKRLGRFGRWEKAVLTHHAYEGAQDALQQL